ncbi:hypothetical protein ACFOYU_24340 [Microvirga sp. GCM10011540]|uniref:hypothetical protein n=1 Tax=Microvirga sp. GCM10011540 TaxID=3317338 RepID=UPI003616DBF1
MLAQFGIEASRAAQYVIAFAIILALVALFGVVLRKLTGSRLMMSGQDRGRSRQPRLGVVDIYELDRQRQLILLRRDNVEHLLLIGGLNDVVIETNIVRVPGARLPTPANEPGVERIEPNLDQAARPAVEGSGRPSIESQLAAQLGAFIKRPGNEDSDIDQELTAVSSVSAPVPAQPEPVLKPDVVHVHSAPAPAPAPHRPPTPAPAPGVHGLRAEARSPAPGVNEPEFGPAVRPPQPAPAFNPPPFVSRPASPPPPPAPPPPAPEVVRAPQPTPAGRPDPDAAILSDMAKQLEEALKRPASPVAPPQATPVPPVQPVTDNDDVVDEDELLEPASEPQRNAAGPGRQDFQDDREDDDLTEAPEPAAEAAPLRPAMDPVRPAPPPPPPPPPRAQPSPPPAANSAPAAPKPSEKTPDPFSVEEIEAEFARLLGRPLDSGKRE